MSDIDTHNRFGDGLAEVSAPEARGRAWYVVNTQPRNEGRAVSHLMSQGFRVYCPRYRRTIRHARKTISALAPLFPSYLFVQFDLLRDRWRCINGTRGVVRLLMWDGVPQQVPENVIDTLMLSTRSDGTFDWTSHFVIGGTVRVADGPFTEMVGTLQCLDAAGRVRILLDLLGRTVSVAVRCESLLPAV